MDKPIIGSREALWHIMDHISFVLGRGGWVEVYSFGCDVQPEKYMQLNSTQWTFKATDLQLIFWRLLLWGPIGVTTSRARGSAFEEMNERVKFGSPVSRIQCWHIKFLQTTDLSKTVICTKRGTLYVYKQTSRLPRPPKGQLWKWIIVFWSPVWNLH